jgi:hypothetical protein
MKGGILMEIILNKQYPVFLCKVDKDKLITTFDWHRTALKGEEFLRISSLKGSVKRKFYKNIYYKNEEGELIKVLDKENMNLCINSETLGIQNMVECIDYNGEGMKQLGIEF